MKVVYFVAMDSNPPKMITKFRLYDEIENEN